MAIQDPCTVSLESNSLECWDDESTASALRTLAVRLHSTGISLRETPAALDQFGITRSQQAVFQWVHRTAEKIPDPPTARVVCERVEPWESVCLLMKSNRRGQLVKHLTENERQKAIKDAQKADETRLVRWLCYIKNLYRGDTREEASESVGIPRATTHRWARAWKEGGVDGLRPNFDGGRPPKLTPAQFMELSEVLELGNRGRHERSTHSSENATASRMAHLSQKLRGAGMKYAKPRPMDPRRPDNAEEILAERLGQALGEDDPETEEDSVIFGFFR
jgi:putative transposase